MRNCILGGFIFSKGDLLDWYPIHIRELGHRAALYEVTLRAELGTLLVAGDEVYYAEKELSCYV